MNDYIILIPLFLFFYYFIKEYNIIKNMNNYNKLIFILILLIIYLYIIRGQIYEKFYGKKENFNNDIIPVNTNYYFLKKYKKILNDTSSILTINLIYSSPELTEEIMKYKSEILNISKNIKLNEIETNKNKNDDALLLIYKLQYSIKAIEYLTKIKDNIINPFKKERINSSIDNILKDTLDYYKLINKYNTNTEYTDKINKLTEEIKKYDNKKILSITDNILLDLSQPYEDNIYNVASPDIINPDIINIDLETRDTYLLN